MANHCVYCDRRWPPEPVRMIALGPNWFECCVECFNSGEGEFENRQTGEKVSFKQLWETLNKPVCPKCQSQNVSKKEYYEVDNHYSYKCLDCDEIFNEV